MAIDDGVVAGAWAIEDRYGFSFLDVLIVSAALVARCEVLLTEDLSHGQRVAELNVVNPFLTLPPTL